MRHHSNKSRLLVLLRMKIYIFFQNEILIVTSYLLHIFKLNKKEEMKKFLQYCFQMARFMLGTLNVPIKTKFTQVVVNLLPQMRKKKQKAFAKYYLFYLKIVIPTLFKVPFKHHPYLDSLYTQPTLGRRRNANTNGRSTGICGRLITVYHESPDAAGIK
jgi:hypothetical protein